MLVRIKARLLLKNDKKHEEENVKKSNSDSSNTTSNNIDRYLIPIVTVPVNLYLVIVHPSSLDDTFMPYLPFTLISRHHIIIYFYAKITYAAAATMLKESWT